MLDEPAAIAAPLLEVNDLRASLGDRQLLDGVSLRIAPGEVLALVGESGCGKSLTALSLLGLQAPGLRLGGSRWLAGQCLDNLDHHGWRALRGQQLAMIFQDPAASLNPLRRIGDQVAETLLLHRRISRPDAWNQAVRMLRDVGISDAERRARQYPFELSGGMCQRVMIAAALVNRPSLLVADEPTTALDVTLQAQILQLLGRLREEAGTAILLISHDLGVVAQVADRVAVMYGGRIVECAPVQALFDAPRHPYTRLLLGSLPRLDGPRRQPLAAIAGQVPDAAHWPEGCRFRDRCPLAVAQCRQVPPLQLQDNHASACWRTENLAS
ncbi:MAG TPA: ABC transporter ATP-binding protein [Pseudomonas sp.]|uniref:ABC transporter ATP-binding protein n=1 Tax=Pseudomonas sp. TaxID=306 RepID=UPI002B46FE5E|nr:ABC transporter ATP-binding protein [Pseudomonas sp.]HKS13615.1 ABC transporter ATP-binding protein [Pseudomonas sp.]